MSVFAQKTRRPAGGLLLIPVEDISPNPLQPRRAFDSRALEELADSIRRYGVLSPLTVRLLGERWELVAGERRLRAAKLAGLREVPCLRLDVGEADAGAVALVENLQREQLDFLEQARGIARLIREYGLSQEEAARRLGKSQSAVANKLRLLRLPEDVQQTLLQNGLTERHGRALLRLGSDEDRREALARMSAQAMTAAAAERYVERLLRREAPAPEGRTLFVLKDVRVFLNTVQHAAELMRQGGVCVDVSRRDSEREMTVTVKISR